MDLFSDFELPHDQVLEFPSLDSRDFPAGMLRNRYVANLLPVAQLSPVFLRLIQVVLGPSRMLETARQVFQVTESEDDDRGAGLFRQNCDAITVVKNLLKRYPDEQSYRALRTAWAGEIRALVQEEAETAAYAGRLAELIRFLGLEPEDGKILELGVLYREDTAFERFIDAHAKRHWSSIISVCTGMPVAEVRRRLAADAPMHTKSVFWIERRCMKPNDRIMEYLLGYADNLLHPDEISSVQTSEFPLDSFPVSADKRDMLKKLIESPGPCHLLLYGRPGTGKTEMAKALAAGNGRKGCMVRYGKNGSNEDRRAALSAAFSITSPEVVMIVDEADALLNVPPVESGSGMAKGWLNNFLDESKHKVIWITNEHRMIDPSVFRRFAFSASFGKFTPLQRKLAWTMQLREHPLGKVIAPEMVARLSEKFEVDAGGIQAAFQSVASLTQGRRPAPAQVESYLTTLLSHHEAPGGMRKNQKRFREISRRYDVSVLNTDLPIDEVIESLRVRERQCETGDGPPANLLFWGLPGTGKTELGKHLAKTLKKKLILKRMSDLQHMYLGETEKAIAAAFAEAERCGAILMLDEVDSLILDRKTATRSWEAGQTNEVLTQMENFSGICICCTNLLSRLDEAVMRRFTWKVKFMPLTRPGKIKLYRRYFQPRGRLAETVRRRLAEIPNLTPGNFKTVRQRFQYTEARPSADTLLAALAREEAFRSQDTPRPVGFQAVLAENPQNF